MNKNSFSNYSLPYRSDIDGLRALAVLGVVFYHAFPGKLPGGFIGVDIFFVISGYLISGILYKGHREGGFSYAEFYARRIRRLFPALITVLLLCLAYGWLVLLPDEYEQLGKHTAAGTIFAQNFVFWKESGYFDKAAELKPLLHLWSLAVEEQFYIVFPLLMILLQKKPKILIPSMIILLVVSFIANLVMSRQSPETDFYLTPNRGWEFLGGSLLVWWHYDKGHEEEVPRYREALSWMGVTLIVAGMTRLNEYQAFPGWRALLPVIGTLLIIEGGRQAWLNKVILSNPVVVWVGLISYPLYLFHWPALSFVHIIQGENAPSTVIWTALGVAFILTLLTYYGIENGCRHNKSSKMVPLLAVTFLLTGFIGVAVWKSWITTPQTGEALKKASIAAQDNGIQNGFTTYPGTQYGKILRLGGSGSQTIFLGDSHMQQYVPRIRKLLSAEDSAGRGAIFIAAPASYPVEGLITTNWNNGKDLMFSFWNEIRHNPNIDRVVIAARWGSCFSNTTTCSYLGKNCSNTDVFKAVMEKLKEEVYSIRKSGKKVYIILDIPTGAELQPENTFLRSYYSRDTTKANRITVIAFLQNDKLYRDKLIEIAKKTDSEFIDPLPFLSKENICISTNQDGPIRCDNSHLRPGFVKDHAVWIDETVDP
jgi:peptidoglycan/LPS O-acetylase OafA/YrhL